MDYSHLKKIKQDEHSTTLRHPNGHELKIAHKALPPEHQQQLAAMPYFDEGGPVARDPSAVRAEAARNFKMPKHFSDDAPEKTAEGSSGAAQAVSDYFKADGGEIEAQTAPAVDEAVSGLESGAAPTMPMSGATADFGDSAANPVIPTPAAAPTVPTVNPMAAVQPDINTYISGLNKQAQSEAQLGKEQEQAAISKQNDIAKLQSDFNSNLTQLNSERKAAAADYANGHIDPNHYVSSMSNPAKVSTAIGLILGGILGTSGKNPAVEYLNQQIDRDIEGQKADMTKKHNILSGLNQQFNDLHQSTVMAKAMMADKYAADMERAAARSMDPMAKARMLQAAAQFKLPYDQQVAQLAQRQAVLNIASKGGNTDPSVLVQHLVPEPQQKEVFKEIQQAQDAQKSKDDFLSQYDEAAKSIGGGLTAPTATKAMRALALPLIHDKEGRVNEFEQKTLSDLEPKVGDKFIPGRLEQKRKALEQFFDAKASAPTAKGFGIDLSKFGTSKQKSRPTPRD